MYLRHGGADAAGVRDSRVHDQPSRSHRESTPTSSRSRYSRTDQTRRRRWLDAASGGEHPAALPARRVQRQAVRAAGPRTPAGWRARAVAGGRRRHRAAEFDAERPGASARCAALTARQQRRARLAIRAAGRLADAALESLAEGVVLANFDNGHHKSKHEGRFFIARVEIAGGPRCGQRRSNAASGRRSDQRRARADQRARQSAHAARVRRARQALLAVPGVTTEILDENRWRSSAWGCCSASARGSAEPPRLLVARYEPRGRPATPVLAWSARASRSTPAASRSSPPTAWSG